LQPVDVDSSQETSPPPCRVIAAASQATEAVNFESQLRLRKAAIVAPIEGSEAATVATTVAVTTVPATPVNAVSNEEEEFDTGLVDDFTGIDWMRLKQYCRPPRTQKRKKSWVYKWGYRVALGTDMERTFWICHDCHQRKVLDVTGEGAAETTSATSSAGKHLKTKHYITKDGVGQRPAPTGGQKSLTMLVGSGVAVSQEVANKIGHFDVQAFRLAAVTWLVDNNIALSQFEQPAFPKMMQFVNSEAELALWMSHNQSC
jgi:hypothetical protein